MRVSTFHDRAPQMNRAQRRALLHSCDIQCLCWMDLHAKAEAEEQLGLTH